MKIRPDRFDAALADLPTEALLVLARNDFTVFARIVFKILRPRDKLLWAPYLDLVAALLGKVATGEIPKLMILMPPRHLKTILVSVALSAFYLGHTPSAEIMNVSYGQDLANEFGEMVQRVMKSPIYRRIFGNVLAPRNQPPHELRTSAGGIRRATSRNGMATGLGCDLIVFDDPQNAKEGLSDAVRRSTNSAYENTFVSRQNDPKSTRSVLVMQRLHEDDFAGNILSRDPDWKVVTLSAIAEIDEEIPYETFLGPQVFRRKEGEPLHPDRFPLDLLIKQRAVVGEAIWATQHQQRPAPADGGIINTREFKPYGTDEKPIVFDRIVQSWDTANKIEQWNDYSLCLTFGIKDGHAYLLDIYRKRVQYPDLKAAVVELARHFQATTILIEDKQSGTQLIQELQRAGFSGIVPCMPVGDKKMRMSQSTSPIRNGFVHVPVDAAFMAEFLHECTVFPKGRYCDQIDALSQALDYIFAVRMMGQGFLDFYEAELRAGGWRG